MSRSVQNHLHHRRRFAGALVLALAFHASLGLLPFPRFSGSWGLQGGSGGGAARGVREAFQAGALQGTEVTLLVPPAPEPVAPAAADTPPEPVPEEPDAEIAVVETPPSEPATSTAAPSDSRETGPAAASLGAAGTPHPGDAPGQGERGEGEPGGGLVPTGPIEMELGSPRLYVHPATPDVVRKRKINDEVILRLLVGTDGLVRDVRVLRAIPNCDECTQSAVETARQFRYAAVTMHGRPVEVWTTWTCTFNSGR